MRDHAPDRARRLLLSAAAAGSLGSLSGLRDVSAARAYAPAAPTAPSAGTRAQLARLTDFQSHPAGDWSAAFNQAVAAARRVYIPPGEYLLRSAAWPSDTEIFGDGDQCMLRMPADGRYLITTDSGSARAEGNISRLYMHHLQLRASCDEDGFSEFRHLLSLNGVSDVRISHVLFKGFRGDGLYLGSGNKAGSERHNRNVRIEDCRFDGINGQNRNGITIIDCDGMVVRNCRFRNLTRKGMPGAIDIEPNPHAFHVVRNIRICNNAFERVGGSVGVIAVYVPAEVAAPPFNILVAENTSNEYAGSGSFFSYNDNRRPSPSSPDNRLRVVGNQAQHGALPFVFASGKGIELDGNVFSRFTQPAYIGVDRAGSSVRDMRICGNTLMHCGSASSSAISVYNADQVAFVGNRFVDPGSRAMAAPCAVLFREGKSSGIVFEDNVFSSSYGPTALVIGRKLGHVFSPGSNRFLRNSLNGMASAFEAPGR